VEEFTLLLLKKKVGDEMKPSTKLINDVANRVMKKLLEAGVKIQYYKAYSSNSVYIKLDYGLANSLRIGDHEGYEHLNYMFKVDVNHNGYRKVESNRFTQYTYAPSKKQVTKLIKHILAHREKRISQYGGIENYQQAMSQQRINNIHNKGFWEKAKVLTEDDIR